MKIDIRTVIWNNTFNKLTRNIERLKTLNYKVMSLNLDVLKDCNWREFNGEYYCPKHGFFNLTGLELRIGKGCSLCKVEVNQNKIDHYNRLVGPSFREEYLKNEFPNLDWSEVSTREFLDLDHTIRPDCKEHGEFITTPRKLFNGDKCKWCDGTQVNDDNEVQYKLSKEEFLEEKVNILYEHLPEADLNSIKIFLPYRYKIDISGNSSFGELSSLKNNNRYLNHLKEVRDPSKWNSILFKINVMDRSSKFQFSIVSVLFLNDTWMDWYNKSILESDLEDAQTNTLNKVLSIWFNTVFYNKIAPDSKDPFQYEIVWSFWSNQKRIESLLSKYRKENYDKLLTLPDSLASKLYWNLEELKVDCYWSDIKWESTSNSVSLFRETILKKTDQCPICKKTINKPVVDHEHKKRVKGTGRIRDNICSNCNVFIAKAENNCSRYGIVLEELPEVLKNVSDYFTQQQYPIIHYTDKDARPILSKTLANKVLKYWNCIRPGKAGKKKLKFPRSGVLTKDWEEAIKDYEAYIAKPAKPLSKNDYKILLRNIEIYNNTIAAANVLLPKTKKKKLLNIPEYPKLKIVTPEIETLLDIINNTLNYK